MYHNPVLLAESINGLNIRSNGIYVDVTYGSGGHSREILRNLDMGKLVAFDQDEDAEANKSEDNHFIFVKQNFAYIKNYLRLYDAIPVDGILADLGVSSHQFDQENRGFSFRFDAPLDMRMSKASNISAKEVVNLYSQDELANIFFNYGELWNAKQIAAQIVKNRSEKAIETTFELKDAVKSLANYKNENKFLAMVFQALRIEVNRELDVLEKLLTQSLDVLKQGGRLVVISYHSLEDRLVKNFMKTGNCKGKIVKDFYGNTLSPFKLISKKAILPSEEEI
ncbi:MAG: 16S rRNA (cytosine(1402)-N(4))-methyltransferase RsmH, partial [Bacteroidales bacterium]|nr:16S rRNA (cytosine(1402)-N(4))-methyltransferase RsmH [Bacteroidales bacterium]